MLNVAFCLEISFLVYSTVVTYHCILAYICQQDKNYLNSGNKCSISAVKIVLCFHIQVTELEGMVAQVQHEKKLLLAQYRYWMTCVVYCHSLRVQVHVSLYVLWC